MQHAVAIRAHECKIACPGLFLAFELMHWNAVVRLNKAVTD